jgi:hypothetical protein
MELPLLSERKFAVLNPSWRKGFRRLTGRAPPGG